MGGVGVGTGGRGCMRRPEVYLVYYLSGAVHLVFLFLKHDLSLVPGAQPAAWAATVLAIPNPKSQAHFYTGLFMWVLGLELRPSVCTVGSFPTELPSCPVTRLLTKGFKIWFCFYCSHYISRNYCTMIKF